MPVRKIETQLAALAALKRGAPGPETLALLRKSLGDPLGMVVAKAAEATSALRMKELVPDLLRAYERLFDGGVKRDAQCWGKVAVAKALADLDHSESAPFVRGLNYQQWEPVWGTEVDTAAPLRSVCNLALLACNDLLREDKLLHLTRGLADAAPGVRLDVARALEEVAGRESVLLLRLKARMGDEEASVTGQVFQSLLALEGAAAIGFVSEFFYQKGWAARNEETMEVAALALGSSRLPEALNLLIDCWQDREIRDFNAGIVLRALSSSRQEQALAFLVAIVRNGRQSQAAAAIEALALHQESESIRTRVLAAVEERESAELTAAFYKAFQ